MSELDQALVESDPHAEFCDPGSLCYKVIMWKPKALDRPTDIRTLPHLELKTGLLNTALQGLKITVYVLRKLYVTRC